MVSNGTRCISWNPLSAAIIYFSYPGFIYIDNTFAKRKMFYYFQSILLPKYKASLWVCLNRYLFNLFITKMKLFLHVFYYLLPRDFFITRFLNYFLQQLSIPNRFIIGNHYWSFMSYIFFYFDFLCFLFS